MEVEQLKVPILKGHFDSAVYYATEEEILILRKLYTDEEINKAAINHKPLVL